MARGREWGMVQKCLEKRAFAEGALTSSMCSMKLYSGYEGSYDKLTFKPSTYKGDVPFAFVPTNLHHQRMLVWRSGAGGVLRGDRGLLHTSADLLAQYHITTFGAPAAHVLKFKGGVRTAPRFLHFIHKIRR